MDLAKIQPKECDCEITHPGNGKKTGLKFQVMSISDDRMQNIRRKLADKTLAKRQRNKLIAQAEIDQNRLDLLFNACTGWTWGESEDGVQANWNGDQPEFNNKNVMEVFKTVPQIADQLDIFIGEEERFFTD